MQGTKVEVLFADELQRRIVVSVALESFPGPPSGGPERKVSENTLTPEASHAKFSTL